MSYDTAVFVFLHAALSVLVSPAVQIVGEGATVSFECLVLGKPVTTIKWARDFHNLKPERVTNILASFPGLVHVVFLYYISRAETSTEAR